MTYYAIMELLEYQLVFLTLAGILGLCIGSFLNVAIYRLPIMLARDLGDLAPKPFNLFFPRSHCPHCQTQIPVWANIPVISYLFLLGRSACCNQKITLRYPITEILCTLLTIYTAYQFGFSLKTLMAMLLVWSLIVLIFIDIEHMILPDNMTLPLIWVGLLVNTQNMFTSPNSAIIGAAAGYSAFWIIGTLFKRLRGMDGLGGGDSKLLAALGAWFGWELLPFILLFSSFCGAAFGISAMVYLRRKVSEPIPFGPFLAIGGLITLFWGYKLVRFTMIHLV